MSTKQVVLTRKAAMIMGALHGFLKPKLAQDAKLDLTGVLGRLTSKNYEASKPALMTGVKKALEGKLAKDASIDGLVELIDALGEEKGGMDDPLPLETEPNSGIPLKDKSMDAGGPDAEIHQKIKAFLADKLSPEDMATVAQLIGSEAADAELGTKESSEKGEDESVEEEIAAKKKEGAKDEPPPFKGQPKPGGEMVTKDGMNKAIKAAVETARESAARTRDAERFVRPWVGDLAMAHDSAEEVYHTALTALSVDVKDVHPSAYKAILERIPVPGKVRDLPAMDSATTSDFAKRYPEAARIKFA